MSKPVKILLGIATLLPFACIVLFYVSFMAFFCLMASGLARELDARVAAFFFLPFVLYFLAFLAIAALLVVYMMHLFKTRRVPKDQRALWAVVLLLGNMLAMPVYWYLYIWREPAKEIEGVSPGAA